MAEIKTEFGEIEVSEAEAKVIKEKMIDFRGYRGDQQLKRAGVQIEWTPELLREYEKCAQDPIYFIEHYMKIITLDHGLQLCQLREFQKTLIHNMHHNRYTITVMARQSGKSTAVIGYLLWYVLFNSHVLVMLLANNADTAREILGKAQIAYLHLPKFIQQGIVEGGWNKGSMHLENGSRALAMSTSDNAARGFSANILVLDETAHIEHWEEFSASVLPTISAGKTSKIFMISTPKGLNHFWTYWEHAKLINLPREKWPEGVKWNGYIPLLVTWDKVPGRDKEWFNQTMMQLNHDEAKFDQEYNCEFMGSSGTLIAGWKLKQLMPRATISPIREGMYKYEDPIPGHSYAITADVSEGKKLNYSAFHVTDISQMPYRQVCVYRNNTVTPGDFAEVLVLSAEAYNHACILIEYMAMGTLVSKEIWDGMEYDNILFTKSMGRSGRQVTQRIDDGADLGLKMTEVTKKQGCLWLKLLIEQDQYLLNNKDTIDELARFSKHNNSFKAEEGATDDLVMSLVVFAWLTNQDYFRDLTNINTMEGLREKKKEEVEDDLTPLGLMMWRAPDEGLMPSTAELHGRNTGDNLVWSHEQRRTKEYSPYVSNDDWRKMYDNPYEKQEDDWDDKHYIPVF